MKTSVLALSALVIGFSIAGSAGAASPTADMPLKVVGPEGESAGWRIEAALQQEPQTDQGERPIDVFKPRPIPKERLNIRRVGPSFFPDPANALDLGR